MNALFYIGCGILFLGPAMIGGGHFTIWWTTFVGWRSPVHGIWSGPFNLRTWALITIVLIYTSMWMILIGLTT
jgi:hypothetical protein